MQRNTDLFMGEYRSIRGLVKEARRNAPTENNPVLEERNPSRPAKNWSLYKRRQVNGES